MIKAVLSFKIKKIKKVHFFLIAVFPLLFMTCILVVNLGSPGCLPGQFLCGDGKCVDRRAICDGYYDCNDAADERDCSEF